MRQVNFEWRGDGQLRTNDISPVVRCTYWLARFVILRLLGLVYLVAFLTAAKQIVPLIGAKGLLPVGQFSGSRPQIARIDPGGFCPPAFAVLVESFGRGPARDSVDRCGIVRSSFFAAGPMPSCLRRCGCFTCRSSMPGRIGMATGGKCSCWRRDSSRFFFARSWMAGRFRGVRRLSSSYGCSDG